jgi:ABC-type Fe3+ transport system permease subunit
MGELEFLAFLAALLGLLLGLWCAFLLAMYD